ncbi:MAG: hypothetical protein HPY76_07365, partial [Anaerolineae bacterium]|nr:hypothetical protein [Anaerolineae bacterium]
MRSNQSQKSTHYLPKDAKKASEKNGVNYRHWVARLLATGLAAGLLFSSCAPAATPTPLEAMSMTFMAGYKPQANLPFVGVYV